MLLAMTTYPPQMLDRSTLTARYRAARAVGNGFRADAIRPVLSYLDHRSRARVTPTGQRYYPTIAEQFNTIARLCWWWAPAALKLAGRATSPAAPIPATSSQPVGR